MLRLHARAKHGVTLSEALAVTAPHLTAGGTRAFTLVASARRCTLGVLRSDGVIEDERGTLDLGEAYEARGFSAQGELRWTHEAGGFGRAVYLSDDGLPDALRTWFDEDLPLDYERALDGTYVLWGQGTGVEAVAGWSVLSTARIGRLVVPCDVPARAGVQLAAREYLACDDHGSASVAEERLLGLELVPAPAEREEANGGA